MPRRYVDEDNALVRWLAANKVSQSELAEHLLTHQTTISRICRNEQEPPLWMAARIEDYTEGGVQMRDLILERNSYD